MESGVPRTVNALDESDVSKDVSLCLGDLERSARSGGRDRTARMQEAKTDPGDADGSGMREEAMPMIATPATGDCEASRPRISAASVPPLPMTTSDDDDAHAAMMANHISPATPMLPPVGFAGLSIRSPGTSSTQSSQDASQQQRAGALAALYHSSRRSRNNTPSSSSGNRPPPTMASFPPPPPLYSASENANHQGQGPHAGGGNASSVAGGEARNNQTSCPPIIHEPRQSRAANQSLRASGNNNVASGIRTSEVPHNVSLHDSNASSCLHESWNTSMSSLMNSSYLNSSANWNMSATSNLMFNPRSSARSSAASQHQHQGQQGILQGVPQGISEAQPMPTPAEAGERPRQPQQRGRPSLADYRIEDRSFRSFNRRSSDETSQGHKSASTAESHSVHSLKAGAEGGRPGSRPGSRTGGRASMLAEYKLEDRIEEGRKSDEDGRKSWLSSSSQGNKEPTKADDAAPRPPLNLRAQRDPALSSSQVRSRDQFERQPSLLKEGIADMTMDDDAMSTHGIDGSNREDDVDVGGFDTTGKAIEGPPPKKKNKMRASSSSLPPSRQSSGSSSARYPATPQTHKSIVSSASFDLIAYPSSRVSSIHDGDVTLEAMLKMEKDLDMLEAIKAEVKMPPLDEGRRRRGQDPMPPQEGEAAEGGRTADRGQDEPIEPMPLASPRGLVINEDAPSVKEQRILRRKVQRLLLIRHCSTCAIPPPPLVEIHRTSSKIPGDDDKNENSPDICLPVRQAPVAICPVTSHCAEGKALCAHIRTCKDENCRYRKCLTSREVLFHYKNCRDGSCEICGPVRALDRRRNGGGGGNNGDGRGRRGSDSSIETIDDEGWLSANMVDVP